MNDRRVLDWRWMSQERVIADSYGGFLDRPRHRYAVELEITLISRRWWLVVDGVRRGPWFLLENAMHAAQELEDEAPPELISEGAR